MLGIILFNLTNLISLNGLTYSLNKERSEFIVGKAVQANQLVVGTIKINEETDTQEHNYSIKIYDEKKQENLYFKKKNIKIGEEISFSFVTSEKQNLTFYLKVKSSNKPKENIYFQNLKNIEISVSANFNFFDDKITEKEFHNPLNRLMVNYLNLLDSSQKRYRKIGTALEKSIKGSSTFFLYLFVFAIGICVSFAVINIRQVLGIKAHFKQKRMI